MGYPSVLHSESVCSLQCIASSVDYGVGCCNGAAMHGNVHATNAWHVYGTLTRARTRIITKFSQISWRHSREIDSRSDTNTQYMGSGWRPYGGGPAVMGHTVVRQRWAIPMNKLMSSLIVRHFVRTFCSTHANVWQMSHIMYQLWHYIPDTCDSLYSV